MDLTRGADPPGRHSRKHLRRLERAWVEPPIYYVTICAQDRRPILTEEPPATAIVEGLRRAASRSAWCVGRYVLMPDHLHFLCGPRGHDDSLGAFVGCFKSDVTREAWRAGIEGRLWQREFFDHLLRSDRSYEQKWEYVRQNPVRKGLVQRPEEWPYWGEVDVL